MVGTFNTVAGDVVPQRPPEGYCKSLCKGDEDCQDWCVDVVLGGLFGEGGPPPERCLPQCLPCQPDPDLGPGLWRTCLNSQCEVNDERCFVLLSSFGSFGLM